MPAYEIEAMNSKGKPVRRRIEASSREEAIAAVKDDGLFPTKAKEVKGASQRIGAPGVVEKKKGGLIFGGVSTRDLTQFTSQLSTLQDAGLPIVRSLRILEAQMKTGRLKQQVGIVADDVEGGSSLSDALSKHPRTFDKLYVQMVRAGEAGGVLDTILRRLAEFMEKSLRLRKRVIGASIYPIAVLVIATLILSGIMIFVIPKFIELFDDMGLEVPPMTAVLLVITELVNKFWFLIPGIPFVFVIVYKAVVRTNGGRLFVDKIKLGIPVFGTIMRKATISRFARTLGTLVASGVPILEALTIVREAIGNEVVARAVEEVTSSIREGESVARPLRQFPVFDEILINMIEVGEETGELDKMLLKIADNYDEDVDVAVESLTSLLEPVLIVGMGLAVGFIVIALFMPLISLISKVTDD
ncbi:MAG: type II secretion system F family protein [Planctomycetota bacterium]|nr:MAG: type II secretion system F family protein [Planctomycetota bacterium]